MRIWIGKEQEGEYKGLITLFIESPSISKKILDKVLEFSNSNKIEQLYFGAGKVPVVYIDSDSVKLLSELSNLYLITIENPISMLSHLPEYVFDNIIGTVDIKRLPNTVKIDTGNTVYSTNINNFITNDLSTVKDGNYTHTDTILYKEG